MFYLVLFDCYFDFLVRFLLSRVGLRRGSRVCSCDAEGGVIFLCVLG